MLSSGPAIATESPWSQVFVNVDSADAELATPLDITFQTDAGPINLTCVTIGFTYCW